MYTLSFIRRGKGEVNLNLRTLPQSSPCEGEEEKLNLKKLYLLKSHYFLL